MKTVKDIFSETPDWVSPSLKVKELQDELKLRNQPTYGLKETLLLRLKEVYSYFFYDI